MLSVGALGFAQPAALLGLIALPALWWLLRTTPPAPQRIVFPPVRFLLGLAAREETAARTPLWLLLVRLGLATALIVGSAGPVVDRGRVADGAGTAVLVVDNGWAAARNWPALHRALDRLIHDADRGRRPVVLATTADEGGAEEALRPMSASEARTRAQAIVPRPWPTDRMATAARLDRLAAAGALADARVYWLSDGLAEPGSGGRDFAAALAALGSLTAFAPDQASLPAILTLDTDAVAEPRVVVQRSAATGGPAALLLAGDDGQPLARREIDFADGAMRASVPLELPPAWQGRLARIEVLGENHAAAVLLLDGGWRRARVGIARPPGGDRDQPLLAGAHYVARALEPHAEVRGAPLPALLDDGMAMIVLIDEAAPPERLVQRLRTFVEGGGVLLRFAGPRLAAAASGDDALLPVRLRGRDRATGGALSWARPAKLAPFADDGPFRGLAGDDDLEIHRQVLAEPGTDGEATVWARLSDGTPLVTARRSGGGWLVLVHTAADPSWSNLPLSGLFVEMLRRIALLATGGAAAADPGRPLPPHAVLDGFGRLGVPPPSAAAVTAGTIATLTPGPRHPPGYYGAGADRRALNLAPALPPPRALAARPGAERLEAYGGSPAFDLRPWLLGAALALALFDLAASLVLRGLLRFGRGRRAAVAATVLTVAVAATAAPAMAAEAVPAAALELRLAFVVTGDAGVDTISRQGLEGLSLVLNQRTAVELGAPDGIDPAVDELVFYPIVYWPLAATAPALSARALDRLRDYRRRGGTIVFDGRSRGTGAGPAAELRTLARSLDLPPLRPAADDHLLRRAYYLLDELPGRWVGEPVWVDDLPADVNDGVATVVAGSHDWAGAWAVDAAGRPLLPVIPGGDRQRELAYRFGVNLVMYALTGSYKADQVHLPAILERLQR